MLDSIADIFLLVATAHYILYPPTIPILSGDLRQYGARAYMLMVFALAMLARTWSIKTLSPLLLAFAFLFSMPSRPLPGNICFSAMQLAFTIQLISIHLPSPTSPFLLIPPNVSLPLMVLIKRSVSLVFAPITLFYLPATLAAAFLLSLSLEDTFFNLKLTLNHSTASPMDSRVTFLVLLGILVLLLLLALVTGAAALPSLCKAGLPSVPHEKTWDKYGLHVGLRARKHYIRALVWYSTPYYFPPPFNILHILIVVGPSTLRTLVGYREPYKPLQTLEKLVWRVTVGPWVAVVASLWLWNVRR